MQQQDDAALLERWREGDREAGSVLLKRHFPALARFFRTKVDQGVDDLIQATMLACVERRDHVRNAAGFRAYLFGVARRVLINAFDERRRGAGKQGVSRLVDGRPSPSWAAVRRRELVLLLKAMRNIPLDLQIALGLYYWERFSTEEIAQVLELPRGTVKSRLRRAKEQLREQLHALSASPQQLKSTVDDLERWAADVAEQSPRIRPKT